MARREDIALGFARQAEFMRDFAPGKTLVIDGIEVKIRGLWRNKVFLEAPSLPGAVPALCWGEIVDGKLVFEVPEAWKEAVKKHGHGLEE